MLKVRLQSAEQRPKPRENKLTKSIAACKIKRENERNEAAQAEKINRLIFTAEHDLVISHRRPP